MNPQPPGIWRVLKCASTVADRLGRSSQLEMLKNGCDRLADLVPEYLPSPSVRTSLGTYSVIALMSLTVALGGAGDMSNANEAAALAPSPVVEKMVTSITGSEAEDLYAGIAGMSIAPDGTATAAQSEESHQDVTSRSSERPVLPTPPNASEFQAEFIMEAAEPAQASQRETGVPASVTIAQAALESDWGRSGLSTKGQNYFGIKAASGPGPAGVINMNTGEYLNGQNVVVNDGFKAYHNMEESFADHGRFLRDNDRYSKCFETKDAREFARRLQSAGYATDPAYATKLIKFMDTFDLYAYDLH